MGNKIGANKQEEASVFMKVLKKKMREWWGIMRTLWRKVCTWWDKRCKWWGKKIKYPYPKMACLLQYGVLFLFVFLFGHVLSGWANHVYFRYPFNDTFRHPLSVTANLTINGTTETYVAEMYADNARSILCTLVGCEAAIVAIVVSLTLIAIELTASEYSPRVIDISLRNLDMWILLLIYGISIFYALVLIKQVPHDSRMLFDDVSFAFWLGVFSYAALFPYLRNIIWLLKPKNIIKRLASEITCEKILTKKEDLFQPIVDITRRSIMNHDFETTRVALIAVTDKAIQAIRSDCGAEISKSFCDHLKGLGKLAASNNDEESTIKVIKRLKAFGTESVGKDPEDATMKAVEALGTVGVAAAKNGLPFAAWEVAKALGAVGVTAVDNKLKDLAGEAVSSLEDVGKSATNKGIELVLAAEQAAFSLKDVGNDAAKEATEENKLGNVAEKVASSLGELGTIAVEKELKKVKDAVVMSLKALKTTAGEYELNRVTTNAQSSLDRLSNISNTEEKER